MKPNGTFRRARRSCGNWGPVGVRSTFGAYRGLIRLALAWLENLTGRYREFKQIRWERVVRVVFVCHGNICRSSYAEGRAVSFGLSAASFGLSADSGAPADPERVQNCRPPGDRTSAALNPRCCGFRTPNGRPAGRNGTAASAKNFRTLATRKLPVDLTRPVEPASPSAYSRPSYTE
jgi:hypothetical protein